MHYINMTDYVVLCIVKKEGVIDIKNIVSKLRPFEIRMTWTTLHTQLNKLSALGLIKYITDSKVMPGLNTDYAIKPSLILTKWLVEFPNSEIITDRITYIKRSILPLCKNEYIKLQTLLELNYLHKLLANIE